MEEAGTLVTDNPNLNRGLSAGLSSTKEKSVSKVLMGLKHLKADDIGVLKYTRSSELGTQVKCSNHAHDVSSRKQVNMWHRDQRIAVAKLARGQQKMFRNLIRVQNEKRRIQRRAHIRKQREMQIELREKAVREREEAQDRLRNMIMTEVPNEKTPDDDDKVFPQPLPEISEERDRETTGGIKMDAGSTALKNGSSHFTRSFHSGDYLHSKETIHSSTTSQSTSRRSPSQNSLSSLRAIPNRETSEVLEMVTKANVPLIPSLKEKSVIKENGTGLISRPHFSREAIQTNVRTALEFEKGDINRNKVLPGIVTNISKDQSCQSYDEGTSYEGRDSVFEDDVTAVTDRAKDQATKETMKRKQSERSRSRNKYHIGIPNRTFRLPDYQAPVVTSVVQYHRNSAGSLVASEVAVKPASEEYKLPSRRAEYMVEKALEWERKREDKRQKKLKGFLDRMKEIERREKMDPRLASSFDHARQEPFHHPTHQSNDRAPSVQRQLTSVPTVQRSVGESLEAYHLKGDKQDLKNCRYLRLNDTEGISGEAEHDSGRLARDRCRGGRRMSSWGVLGLPHGEQLTTGKLTSHRRGHYHSVRF